MNEDLKEKIDEIIDFLLTAIDKLDDIYEELDSKELTTPEKEILSKSINDAYEIIRIFKLMQDLINKKD